jgi:hypothetical protein
LRNRAANGSMLQVSSCLHGGAAPLIFSGDEIRE